MATTGERRRGHGVRSAIAVAALPLASVGIEAPAADAAHGRSVERITFTEVGLDLVDFNIADIRVDGSDRRRLTSSPAYDIAPDYSPDGRRIAFTSGRSAPPGSEDDPAYSETYVMNADGSHVRRITFNRGLFDLAPAWSPDGRHLVVGRGPSDPEGHADLWIINLATGRAKADRFSGHERVVRSLVSRRTAHRLRGRCGRARQRGHLLHPN